jgi:Eco57I restriction-modification methylase
LDDFRAVLARVAEHPNSRYFVLKSIIIGNLYGVDIMEEAVEICKLRLFLRLVSVVARIEELEPLPDVDFNIRAGNSLVGYTTQEEVTQAISSRLDFDDQLARITASAQEAADAFDRFRVMQTEGEPTSDELAACKAELRSDMEALRASLDLQMASAMISNTSTTALEGWINSHHPFHWLVEFYGIMRSGGFDVVVGNPPYVGLAASATSEACGIGTPFGRLFIAYRTVGGGNLYALFGERSLNLLRPAGRWSLVVPLSITFGREFVALRQLIAESSRTLWYASFDNIPDRVFTGAKESQNTSKANQQRVTICIAAKDQSRASESAVIQATPILRWRASERAQLLASLPYSSVSDIAGPSGWPKIAGDSTSVEFVRTVAAWPKLESLVVDDSRFRLVIPRTAGYYIAAYEDPKKRSKQMTLSFRNAAGRDLAQVVLNSDVFFFWYRVWGDGFDVTRSLVGSCPIPPEPKAGFRDLARALAEAQTECTVYKGYRGVDVPNVNYNLRMDLLWECDRWFWSHLGWEGDLPWRDLLRYKSSSWFSFEIAKSRSWPVPYTGLGMRTAD